MHKFQNLIARLRIQEINHKCKFKENYLSPYMIFNIKKCKTEVSLYLILQAVRVLKFSIFQSKS